MCRDLIQLYKRKKTERKYKELEKSYLMLGEGINKIYNTCLDSIYDLSIYNKENEFIVKANNKSCFAEAKHYREGNFYGYNLLIYTNEQFKLLATYDNGGDMIADRIRIENAIKLKDKEIYLSSLHMKG